MLVSVIVPVFNEPKGNIEELRARIAKVCFIKNYEYEILFVDDGSRNDILNFLKVLHNEDKKIKILSFDKNYGQEPAFLAGLYNAKGDIIFLLDADLQYSPEEIPRFIDKINQGYDIVGGKRRKDSVGFLSKNFTGFLNIVSKAKSSDYGCSYNAFKKECVMNMLNMGYPLSLKFSIIISAQNRAEIEVTYNERKYGKSTYSFIRYIFLGIKYVLFFLIRHKKRLTPPYKIVLSMLD